MKIHVSYAICKGKEKVVCDDTALLGVKSANEEEGELEVNFPGAVCLCDGVGGNAGGREASLFVAEEIGKLSGVTSEEELKEGLLEINRRLIEKALQTEKQRQMATTLTGLMFSESGVFLMQAGNTRLYAYRGGYLQQVTEDQTTFQWLKAIGQDEAAEGCNKSEIRCAFGGGTENYLKYLEAGPVFERRIPEVLLLTTDGVHDTLTNDEMEEIFGREGSFLEKAKRLTEEALKKGTTDDRSAVVVRIQQG